MPTTAPELVPSPDRQTLHSAVIDWYFSIRRPLPWREPTTTPWGVLVSEVMAQQTPVARVAPFWTAWMRRWPTPQALADAAAADVLRAWGSLGYPRRALRLQAAATAICDRHDGVVPAEFDALLALPGVGSYTAAAVATFAFGRRHAVVDVNVRRVLARAVGAAAEPAPSLTVHERRLAELLLPQDPALAADWSVAVMELGALICTARSPKCLVCPVLEQCAWQLAGRPDSVQAPRRRQSFEGTDRQARGRLLAVLRAQDGPADVVQFEGAWPPAEQRERALASLVADGLVVGRSDGRYALPGSP